MSNKDYYEILGVSKNAGERDIKIAYKRLAIKYHPDRNKGDKLSEEKFKEVKKAYEVLSDNKKRAAYDQYGHSFEDNTSGFSSEFTSSSDFSDIFGDVFGDIFGVKKKTSSVKGSDIFYEVNLTLDDAVKGVSKEIKIYVMQKCSVCRGSGSRPGTKRNICSVCKGTGNLRTRQGFFTVQQTCPSCRGLCYVINNPCYVCRGQGIEKTFKKLNIKIPSGVNHGDRIRLVGKGNYGDYGGVPGDLYIKIKIKKHSIFNREKNDLYCKVPINFSMAALGGEVEIPTLSGKIKLKIPPETQTGRLFRVKYKGVKSIRDNSYGDLICKVFIETPVNLNEYQKKLLYDLGFSLTGFNKEEKNNLKSKSFFDRVKKFFDGITR